MTLSRLRAGYYALTAANVLATSYYLNYLFFYLRDRFAFGNRENLWVSALYGGLYVPAAIWGGRFAERRGYDTSIQIGFGALALCMLGSLVFDSVPGLLILLSIYSVVLLLTWPALEAIATADAPPSHVPRLVGLYNCTWSSASALAYFTGGALYDGLGRVAVFWIPAGLFVSQYAGAMWLARHRAAAVRTSAVPAATHGAAAEPEPAARIASVSPRTFLRLAWIANPFSYVAIYTLFPIMPGLAARLGLSPTQTGVFCSAWLFARLATFAVLWRWTGWHYRFRWLAAAAALQVVSFALILLAPTLAWLLVAQITFGAAIGLIYYSSLFYSMDAGDTKAEHGGIHEAAIGVGSFAGPAVGALALHLVPRQLDAGAMAVSGLLAGGWVAIVWIWWRARLGSRSDTGAGP